MYRCSSKEEESLEDVPLKSQCFTPAVTPSPSYFEEDDASAASAKDVSPRYDVYREEPISPCGSSPSSAKGLCFKITVKDTTPGAALPPPQTSDCSPKLSVDSPEKARSLSLHATISDEEDAVEVTLGVSSFHIDDSLASPAKKTHQATTPSPRSFFDQQQINNLMEDPFQHASPQTPVRLNFCGMQDWCDPSIPTDTKASCGENSFCFVEDDQQQRAVLEGKILQSLGEGWCHPWQETYTTSPTKCNNSNNVVHQHTMKRRAFDLAARRSRLATLRRDLNPFQAPSPSHRLPLGRSHSFNMTSTRSATKQKKSVTSQDLVPIWECGALDCTEPEHDSPAAIRLQWEEECHGYDSDPEDYPKENGAAISISTQPPVASDNNIDGFMNGRITLIQHCNGTSVAVQTWIEKGQKLRDQTILPKLVWKRLYHSSNKNVMHQRVELSSIDLLDICRILNVEELDRDKCPFAVKSRAFSIRTIHRDPVIFEAQSEGIKDQFVCNLKHIISRLAAKLLTRDPSAMDFFAEDYGPGPGQQPFLPQRLEAWV